MPLFSYKYIAYAAQLLRAGELHPLPAAMEFYRFWWTLSTPAGGSSFGAILSGCAGMPTARANAAASKLSHSSQTVLQPSTTNEQTTSDEEITTLPSYTHGSGNVYHTQQLLAQNQLPSRAVQLVQWVAGRRACCVGDLMRMQSIMKYVSISVKCCVWNKYDACGAEGGGKATGGLVASQLGRFSIHLTELQQLKWGKGLKREDCKREKGVGSSREGGL
jgi:hypothetical protein